MLAIKFYYPGRFLGWELTTIFLYLLLDESRLFLGKLAFHRRDDI